MGEYTPVTEITQEEEHTANDGIEYLNREQKALDYASWAEFGEAFGMEDLDQWDEVQIPNDCITFAEIKVDNEVLSPDFVWPKQKTAVFEQYEMEKTQGFQEHGWTCFSVDTDPTIIANKLKE